MEVKRFWVNGEHLSIAEMAERAGVDRKTMNSRMQYMSPEDAMKKPTQVPVRYRLGLREMPLDAICWELDIGIRTLRDMAKANGSTLQDVIDGMYDEKVKRDKARMKSGKNDEPLPVIARWCYGCEWAKWVGDVCTCPFVEGSCARIPETMKSPVQGLKSGEDFRRMAAVLKMHREKMEEDSEDGGEDDCGVRGEPEPVSVAADGVHEPAEA